MTRLFAFRSEIAEQLLAIADPSERIRTRNELTRAQFEKDVLAAHWIRMRNDYSFVPPRRSAAIVIGAALWSEPDLDILARFASREGASEATVYIFDLDEVHSEEDLRRLMPGVPLPTKTPVVATYAGGDLQRWAQGKKAANLLE